MKRRSILKGVLAGAFVGFRLPLALAGDHHGKFFVFVHADGGWDPTSFCDPKPNTPGEPIINHWAETDEPRTAGNIPYAPFAENEPFFENHHDKMLVINGVDAQTNAHTAGIVHNWSGRIEDGYPSLTALLAAHHAPEHMPMSYLSFGGFSRTAGLVRFTRLDSPDRLRGLARPYLAHGDPANRLFDEDVWADIEFHREETAARLAGQRSVVPMQEYQTALHASGFKNAESLEAYADAIPQGDELEQPVEAEVAGGEIYRSELRQQAQLAVLAFKTGVAVSADLYMGGFDTHDNHDRDHEWLLSRLTDGVSYLWEYAEKHEIADDLVVLMGSDFGRTNRYNSQEGKDHWPYGSFIVMEKNQTWTNRVVGETDELHFAHNIDPATLERTSDSDPNGTHIYPKHVHKALRRYLGIENSTGARQFPFDDTGEDFAFFG